MSDTNTTHTEHVNGRRAMDDLQRRMVAEGMRPADAEKRAREAALREDRKRNAR